MRPNFTDASKVAKYEMPPDEYEQKTDSVLAWKKANKLGRFDPSAPTLEEAKLQAIDAEIKNRGIEVGKRCRVGEDDSKRGERSLENALPWQQIDSARYSPFDQSDLSAALSNIRSLHQTRVADDPGFEFLLSNQTLDNEIAALEVVSLLESKRQVERTQRQSVRDSLTTALRKAWNLGEDEKASDGEFPGDIVLNETAQILTDTMLELRHNRMLAQHSAHSSAESDSSKQDQ